MLSTEVAGSWDALVTRSQGSGPHAEDIFYLRQDLYDLPWHGVDLGSQLWAIAPNAGPIAMIRDSRQFVEITSGPITPTLQIYNGAGALFSSMPWHAMDSVAALAWTPDDHLMVIDARGRISLRGWDCKELKDGSFSLPLESNADIVLARTAGPVRDPRKYSSFLCLTQRLMRYRNHTESNLLPSLPRTVPRRRHTRRHHPRGAQCPGASARGPRHPRPIVRDLRHGRYVSPSPFFPTRIPSFPPFLPSTNKSLDITLLYSTNSCNFLLVFVSKKIKIDVLPPQSSPPPTLARAPSRSWSPPARNSSASMPRAAPLPHCPPPPPPSASPPTASSSRCSATAPTIASQASCGCTRWRTWRPNASRRSSCRPRVRERRPWTWRGAGRTPSRSSRPRAACRLRVRSEICCTTSWTIRPCCAPRWTVSGREKSKTEEENVPNMGIMFYGSPNECVL